MENKLFLKSVFILGLFFSLFKNDLKSDSGIILKSDELKKRNLSEIDENKVLKDYAQYIVNIVFSNSGILDNIQNEEQEELIKKQMDRLVDKIISNKQFRELGIVLLKEQMQNVLVYKDFNKKINLLKFTAYSLAIVSTLGKAFWNKENYSNYISSLFSGLSVFSLIYYFENLSKKEKKDTDFENSEFSKSEKAMGLVAFCYEKIIGPYFASMQKEVQKNPEEVQKINQSSND